MLRKLTLYILALLVITTLVPALPSHAQDGGGTICYSWASLGDSYAKPVRGTITNEHYKDIWRFVGHDGVSAQVVMTVTEGSLEPFIYITNEATGVRILSSTANVVDEQATVIVRIDDEDLDEGVSYSITVTRLGEATGPTTGSYRMTLEQTAAAGLGKWDNSIAEFHANIYDGEIVSGGIYQDDRLDAWYFSGREGDTVTIIVRAVGDTAFSYYDQFVYLAVLDRTYNRWTRLAEVGSSDGSEMKIEHATLTSTEDYVIAVRAYDGPVPPYELFLAGSGGTRPNPLSCTSPLPPCPVNSPLGTPAITLLNNEPVTGGINVVDFISTYQFSAYEGDVVTITMQRIGGDLDTLLGLVDSGGNILARDESDDPALSTLNRVTIGADGCYFVYAAREGIDAGTTEGTYTLTATGIPQGNNVPQPPADIPFIGDIEATISAAGAISSDDWQAAYRFEATETGPYVIQAVRVSGDLKPTVRLLNGDLEEISYVSANFAGNASNVLTINANEGEYYFIVVEREGGATGPSNGEFSLTITPN